MLRHRQSGRAHGGPTLPWSLILLFLLLDPRQCVNGESAQALTGVGGDRLSVIRERLHSANVLISDYLTDRKLGPIPGQVLEKRDFGGGNVDINLQWEMFHVMSFLLFITMVVYVTLGLTITTVVGKDAIGYGYKDVQPLWAYSLVDIPVMIYRLLLTFLFTIIIWHLLNAYATIYDFVVLRGSMVGQIFGWFTAIFDHCINILGNVMKILATLHDILIHLRTTTVPNMAVEMENLEAFYNYTIEDMPDEMERFANETIALKAAIENAPRYDAHAGEEQEAGKQVNRKGTLFLQESKKVRRADVATWLIAIVDVLSKHAILGNYRIAQYVVYLERILAMLGSATTNLKGEKAFEDNWPKLPRATYMPPTKR